MRTPMNIRYAALVILIAAVTLTGCGQGNPILSSAPESAPPAERTATVDNQPRSKAIADVLNLNAEQRAALEALRTDYSTNIEDMLRDFELIQLGPEGRESLEAQAQYWRDRTETAFFAILTVGQQAEYERLKAADPDFVSRICRPE